MGQDDRGAIRKTPIPIRLQLTLTNDDALELASLLREIVKNVQTQRSYAQCSSTTARDARTSAARCARFEIVEVVVGERASGSPANAESLKIFANLVALGIRVRRLPLKLDEDQSVSTRLSILRSLHILFVQPPQLASLHHVEYVYVDDDSSDLAPALFSAIQVSRSLKCIELDVPWDTLDWDHDFTPGGMFDLWQWAAYALFSRHAHHHVEKLILHVDFFNDLEVVEQVLGAANPLAALYETTFEDDRWIEASRFHVEDFNDDPSVDEFAVYHTPTPIAVRVIDRAESNGGMSWRVLLPGCGEAWVVDTDASIVTTREVHEMSAVQPPLIQRHITLEGMVPRNLAAVASFFRLAPDYAQSIEVLTPESIVDGFDMTDWSLDLLQNCPNLERLELPWSAQISQLRGIVELAQVGHLRLRYLSRVASHVGMQPSATRNFDVCAVVNMHRRV